MSPFQRCLTLLLGAAFLTPQVVGSSESTVLTRIDLERGRALIIDDSGVSPLRRHEGTRTLAGPGHFELAPGSEAVLRWPGQGSLQLSGPASLSWDRQAESGELRLRFGTLHEARIELRQGSARLDLPGAWRVELNAGAFSLRSLPSGGATFTHHAGSAVRASWVGGAGVSAPAWMSPGDELRLTGSRQASAGNDATASAADWPAMAWPWGRGPIHAVPDLPIPGSTRWPAGDWPWGTSEAADEVPAWERWDWPWGAWVAPEEHGVVAPQGAAQEPPRVSDPIPTLPAPIVDEPLAVPEQPVVPSDVESREEPSVEPEAGTPPTPVVVPEPEPEPQPEPPVSAAPEPQPEPAPKFPNHSWRGLGRAQLVDRGHFVLQISEDWIHEPLPDGQQRFSIASGAHKPAWYFGPTYDFRVFPGGSMLVGVDGSVVSHEGWVRILHTTSGRAPLEQD